MNVQDVLNMYCKPTPYEQDRGITINGPWVCVYDESTIKYFTRLKSNNRQTLLIIFKSSIGNDTWCGWMLSEDQANSLRRSFPIIYNGVEYENAKVSAWKTNSSN